MHAENSFKSFKIFLKRRLSLKTQFKIESLLLSTGTKKVVRTIYLLGIPSPKLTFLHKYFI